MRPIENCNHFWKALGEPGHVWFDSHAIARCLHCYARTVVEYKHPDGVGPCPHAVGRGIAGVYFMGEPPLEKEESSEAIPEVDPAYVECKDCQDLIDVARYGEEIFPCAAHRPKTKKPRKRAKA